MMLRADKNTPEYIYAKLAETEKLCIPDGWSAESFKSESLKDNGIVLYIQENDGIISALLTAYTAIGEADITNVAVLPEYRRKGYATALISEFEKAADDFPLKILLEKKYSSEGYLPFVTYCYYKLAEIKNVRIILVGLLNGESKTAIKNRLRLTYEG